MINLYLNLKNILNLTIDINSQNMFQLILYLYISKQLANYSLQPIFLL